MKEYLRYHIVTKSICSTLQRVSAIVRDYNTFPPKEPMSSPLTPYRDDPNGDQDPNGIDNDFHVRSESSHETKGKGLHT